jgi:hypothetical protein
VLYVVSFGPACWRIGDKYYSILLADQDEILSPPLVAQIFWPLLQVVKWEEAFPEALPRPLTWWALFGDHHGTLRISGLTMAQFPDQFDKVSLRIRRGGGTPPM